MIPGIPRLLALHPPSRPLAGARLEPQLIQYCQAVFRFRGGAPCDPPAPPVSLFQFSSSRETPLLRPDNPSRTAIAVAIHRAAHQVLDQPAILADPMAFRILPAKAQVALQANPRHYERRLFANSLRAHLAVRSRLAEDTLAEAIATGVRQYVVLGAGLDTFALRTTNADLRIFEVDFPSTQGWKRRRLQEAGIAEPPGLTFVPIDFEREELGSTLTTAGFDSDAPAFFSWLGVVPYLEKEAIWRTLRWVAGVAGRGGGIVFDYAAPPAPWHLPARALLALFKARVAAAGEPLKTLFQPDYLGHQLSAIGFTRVRDQDRSALNRSYFAGRADGLRVRGLGHLVVAHTT